MAPQLPPGVIALTMADGEGALAPAAIDAAARALRDHEGDVVLIGGPAGFCRGLDLRSVVDGHDTGHTAFLGLLDQLDRWPGTVVALVDGAALGGGLGLCAVADRIVATPDARFGLPEVLWGLLPAAVFPPVARRIGVGRARSLALTGTSIDAATALAWGLVDEVTDDPWRSVRTALRRGGRAERGAVGATKRLVADTYGQAWLCAAVPEFRRLLARPVVAERIGREVP